MQKKYYSYDDALIKLQQYCAYQDRCHQEVRNKIMELGLYGEELERLIADLIEEKFLDELRFAQSFAGGKFRIKNWGKTKIIQALKAKRVSEYCIRKAIEKEIPMLDYYSTLLGVLEKKDALIAEPVLYKRKQKLAQYAISRGFESFLVWDAIEELDLK